MGEYWKKRKNAFKYAWQGIVALITGEAHAAIHLVAACLVIIFALICRIAAWEWCCVIICMGGVFMAEAFNSAIERVCDKVSPEWHPLIKQAKDLAAGAVLLFVIACVAVAGIIFLPKILSIFF